MSAREVVLAARPGAEAVPVTVPPPVPEMPAAAMFAVVVRGAASSAVLAYGRSEGAAWEAAAVSVSGGRRATM